MTVDVIVLDGFRSSVITQKANMATQGKPEQWSGSLEESVAGSAG